MTRTATRTDLTTIEAACRRLKAIRAELDQLAGLAFVSEAAELVAQLEDTLEDAATAIEVEVVEREARGARAEA